MSNSNANTQNKGLVNLEYVASNIRMLMSLDNRWQEKILQLVINGYSQLQLNDTVRNIKTVVMTVDDTNVAYFPSDYVEYVVIAIRYGGRLTPLTLNRNIILPSEESCGDFVREQIQTGTNEAFDDRLKDWFRSPHLTSYTVGGAFSNAYYRIDHDNGMIVFLTNNFTGLEVIMEYKALDISNETVIPRQAVPALTAYVDWQLTKHNRKMSETRIEATRRDWNRENKKLYAVNHALTAEEMLDLMRKHTHRGLKG